MSLSSLGARPLGSSAPRPLGPSAPQPLGPSAPRPLGPSAPRPLSRQFAPPEVTGMTSLMQKVVLLTAVVYGIQAGFDFLPVFNLDVDVPVVDH